MRALIGFSITLLLSGLMAGNSYAGHRNFRHEERVLREWGTRSYLPPHRYKRHRPRHHIHDSSCTCRPVTFGELYTDRYIENNFRRVEYLMFR